MKVQGRCYCGAVRYEVEGEPMLRGQCHCRECQYISGGGVNYVFAMPEAGLSYTKGKPASFQRSDLETPVTREFCSACGTHLMSRAPGLEGMVMIKVGTLDDPSVFGSPQMAIFHCDAQPFHSVPEGCSVFERLPG